MDGLGTRNMSGTNLGLDVELDPPPMWLAALEMPRMFMDMMQSPSAMVLGRYAPAGDGHPVLVVPPFCSDDAATACMRDYLQARNYAVYGWGLGENRGPETTGRDGAKLVRRVEEIFERGNRKLSLVGWSLGGIQARELAKGMRDTIRQVITVSSPFGGGANATHGSGILAEMSGDDTATEEYRNMLRQVKSEPENIPCTAIFSKSDGIANWRACVERPGPMTDNIEVVGSHCGMGYNPAVLFAVADRLAADPEHWTPFDRNGEPWRKFVYPSSGHCYGH